MGDFITKESKVSEKDKKRSYNWGTIIYPESVNPSFCDIINESGVATVISPLHDSDIVKDTGELKKPHNHVIMHFNTLKSRLQVLEFVSTFGGVGAEPIVSMEGSVQYLCHLNNPDKVQYNVSDIVSLCGFDWRRYMPQPDSFQIEIDILKLIETYNITHLSCLQRVMIKKVESEEMTKSHMAFLRKNSYYWQNILKSRTHEKFESGHFDMLPKGMDFDDI